MKINYITDPQEKEEFYRGFREILKSDHENKETIATFEGKKS